MSLKPSSLMMGEAGDLKGLRGAPRSGLFLSGTTPPARPIIVQENGSLVADGWITSCGSALATFARQNSIRQRTTSREVKYVSYYCSSVSSCSVHCCIFGAGLVPLRLARSAGLAPEGFGGRPCYRKFHRSLHQQPWRPMSGCSLSAGRTSSWPSGRIPDIEKLDVGLPGDHSRVRTFCQPDHHSHKMDRNIRGPKWPSRQGARRRDFPAHLNETPGGWRFWRNRAVERPLEMSSFAPLVGAKRTSISVSIYEYTPL
jgi:hypothetical protein